MKRKSPICDAFFQIGKIEPPSGGFWELGEWHESTMENPWKYALNPKMAPFDQQFFLILNLAVGGTEYFSDEASNPGGKPWNNESPTVRFAISN